MVSRALVESLRRAADAEALPLLDTPRFLALVLPDGYAAVFVRPGELRGEADVTRIVREARGLARVRSRVLRAFAAATAAHAVERRFTGVWVLGAHAKIPVAVDERLSGRIARRGEEQALAALLADARPILGTGGPTAAALLAGTASPAFEPATLSEPAGALCDVARRLLTVAEDPLAEDEPAAAPAVPALDPGLCGELDVIASDAVSRFTDAVVETGRGTGAMYWPSWFFDPARFTPDDDWMSREEWARLARACLARDEGDVAAVELLLTLTPDDDALRAQARELLDDWWADGGEDAESFSGLLVLTPDHPAAREVLDDAALPEDEDVLLLRAGRLPAERRVALRARLARAAALTEPDLAGLHLAVTTCLEELTALGAERATCWFDEPWLADVHEAARVLARAEGEALLDVIGTLAPLCPAMGWEDVLATLEQNPWTPGVLQQTEPEEIVLALSRWPHTRLGLPLAAQALADDDEDTALAGAIAWKRLRRGMG